MKKSLVALAVLAASGAAMAQSSVTLYGILDTFVGSNSVDKGDGKGSVSTTHLGSGAVNGSRWGMKGSEDLGGGLKANFDLQSGFNIDTGSSAQGGLLFGRGAWVGLSGGFGAVRLGRTALPYYDAEGAQDAVFNSALSAEANVFRSTTANPGVGYYAKTGVTVRSDNTIRYDLPSMNGFGAAVSYSLNEKAAGTVGTPKVGTAGTAGYIPAIAAVNAGLAVTSMSVTYAGGPVAVSFGYQNEALYNQNAIAAPTGVATYADLKFTRLQGSYDLGGVVAKAGYGKAGNVGNVSGADATEFMLGADYIASSALTLSANYANSKDNTTLTAATAEAKRTGYGLGAAYTLSKRTFLFGGYESDTQTQTGKVDAKHSLFAVGMQHRF
jgi:predicted porin